MALPRLHFWGALPPLPASANNDDVVVDVVPAMMTLAVREKLFCPQSVSSRRRTSDLTGVYMEDVWSEGADCNLPVVTNHSSSLLMTIMVQQQHAITAAVSTRTTEAVDIWMDGVSVVMRQSFPATYTHEEMKYRDLLMRSWWWGVLLFFVISFAITCNIIMVYMAS